MLKEVVMLCILIACSRGAPASGDDPGSSLEPVSGQASATNQTDKNKHDEATTELADVECTVKGVKGICVKYFLCKETSSYDDSSHLIDIHKRSVSEDEDCPSYLDTCCPPSSIFTS